MLLQSGLIANVKLHFLTFSWNGPGIQALIHVMELSVMEYQGLGDRLSEPIPFLLRHPQKRCTLSLALNFFFGGGTCC